MKIVIAGKEFELRYSFRSLILFERFTGYSFVGGSLNDELHLLLCQVLSSAPGCNVTFDELCEALDETPQLLTEWRKWLSSQIEAQNAKMQGASQHEGKSKGKKKA